jgi:hypothetical protein
MSKLVIMSVHLKILYLVNRLCIYLIKSYITSSNLCRAIGCFHSIHVLFKGIELFTHFNKFFLIPSMFM